MNALQALDTLIAFVTVLTICSMFVLIVVQMVSAALSLRGKNLANALATTFQTVAPELKEKAHMLAQCILTNPALSDSMWKDKDYGKVVGEAIQKSQWQAWMPDLGAFKLANAIRPEEVLAALQKLAARKSPQEAVEAFAKASTDAEKEAAMKKWPEIELQSAAIELLQAAGMPDVAKDKLSAVFAIVETLDDPALKQRLESAIGESAGKLSAVVQNAETHLTDWLNAAQDRAQQWFQTHARVVTIVSSVLFALICQIDAVELFQYVSTDSKARATLVEASAKIIAEGGDTLDDKGGLPARVAAAWNEQQATLSIEVNPRWQNVSEVEAEAHKKLADPAAFQSAFDAAVKAGTKGYFGDQERRLRGLEETFQATGYDIFPAGGSRWNKQGTGCPLFDSRYWWHLPGMMLFAGLLSLGAPYWFNLLKNLASLRPVLAQMIGAEQQTDGAAKK